MNGFGGGSPDEAALYEMLSQRLGPEGLQQMIDAGLFSDRSQLTGQEMGQAQGMIDTPGAQGMRVGGTYVASSPLEHASVAMARVMGQQKMNQARQNQGDLITGKGKGMEALLRAMSRPGQAQQDPNAAPPWMPPGPYSTF